MDNIIKIPSSQQVYAHSLKAKDQIIGHFNDVVGNVLETPLGKKFEEMGREAKKKVDEGVDMYYAPKYGLVGGDIDVDSGYLEETEIASTRPDEVDLEDFPKLGRKSAENSNFRSNSKNTFGTHTHSPPPSHHRPKGATSLSSMQQRSNSLPTSYERPHPVAKATSSSSTTKPSHNTNTTNTNTNTNNNTKVGHSQSNTLDDIFSNNNNAGAPPLVSFDFFENGNSSKNTQTTPLQPIGGSGGVGGSGSSNSGFEFDFQFPNPQQPPQPQPQSQSHAQSQQHLQQLQQIQRLQQLQQQSHPHQHLQQTQPQHLQPQSLHQQITGTTITTPPTATITTTSTPSTATTTTPTTTPTFTTTTTKHCTTTNAIGANNSTPSTRTIEITATLLFELTTKPTTTSAFATDSSTPPAISTA
eukprot:TRINITY_DN3262_c0_g4_i1.p1 TRINITY_DN3262_c0_g4~~TRINITY_DN3262_c0_g4_i1.p1  ORF type:complete len:414 (-),score=130.13 TRINITY_DN3262_c0_g4_i1:111-1352(-)